MAGIVRWAEQLAGTGATAVSGVSGLVTIGALLGLTVVAARARRTLGAPDPDDG